MVSRGVEGVELAWAVEVSRRCRGWVSRWRGHGTWVKRARASAAVCSAGSFGSLRTLGAWLDDPWLAAQKGPRLAAAGSTGGSTSKRHGALPEDEAAAVRRILRSDLELWGRWERRLRGGLV